MTSSNTRFATLYVVLFGLFVSLLAAEEPYKLSDERIEIINRIIAKSVADKEDLTDPAVIQTIYDRIGAEMPLSPEEPVVQIDSDKLKKKARIRTLKKFKYSPEQMKDKFAAEAKKKYPLAQVRDKVTVIFKRGSASVSGTLYRINPTSILVNSTTVSFIDMDEMTRSRFDASRNREICDQYVQKRLRDYRFELNSYQEQVLHTLQAEAKIQAEKKGYIFLKRQKTWSTAKEIASAELAPIIEHYRRIKAAEQGDVQAQYDLAVMYAKGQGMKKDDAEAVKWYRKAAEQGHADAQYHLGNAYAHGRGVAKDESEAVKWFRKAAEQGHAEAQCNFAEAYLFGSVIPQNYAEAVKWYRKAAEQGVADAQYNLGVSYAKGNGVTQDVFEAVRWYRKAAEKGHTDAQYNLGVSYENGNGITQDVAEAVRWYRMAAEKGNVNALHNLGVVYARQELYSEAATFFRQAAMKGDGDSQFKLGLMYAQGIGVRQSDIESLKWLRKAAEQGQPEAQRILQSLR